MRAPPITIACECGELRHVPYGERWVCEACGRRWNTAQIPADEYWGIMRRLRRERLVVIGLALALTLVFGLLALLVSEGLFLFLPVLLVGWFIWYQPLRRRRMRRYVRGLPKWQLTPE